MTTTKWRISTLLITALAAPALFASNGSPILDDNAQSFSVYDNYGHKLSLKDLSFDTIGKDTIVKTANKNVSFSTSFGTITLHKKSLMVVKALDKDAPVLYLVDGQLDVITPDDYRGKIKIATPVSLYELEKNGSILVTSTEDEEKAEVFQGNVQSYNALSNKHLSVDKLKAIDMSKKDTQPTPLTKDQVQKHQYLAKSEDVKAMLSPDITVTPVEEEKTMTATQPPLSEEKATATEEKTEATKEKTEATKEEAVTQIAPSQTPIKVTPLTPQKLPLGVTSIIKNDSGSKDFDIYITTAGNLQGQTAAINLAKLGTLYDTIRSLTKNNLMLGTGNITNFVHSFNDTQLQSAANIVGELGFDAIIPGAEDFNTGTETVSNLAQYSRMNKGPLVLSANVLDPEGKLMFQPYQLYNYNGYTVLVTGLTGTNKATENLNLNIADKETILHNANAYIKEAKTFADFVIVVSNVDDPLFNAQSISTQIKGIDLVVDGSSEHSSTYKIEDTHYIAPGEGLQNIGLIDIHVTDGKLVSTRTQLVHSDDINKSASSTLAKQYGITHIAEKSAIVADLHNIQEAAAPEPTLNHVTTTAQEAYDATHAEATTVKETAKNTIEETLEQRLDQTTNSYPFGITPVVKNNSFNTTFDIYVATTGKTHGAIDGISYAKLGTLFDAGRALTKNTLLLDAGNSTSGNNIINKNKGEIAKHITSLLDYDAIIPGAGDFAYGIDNLVNMAKANKENGGPTLISSNALDTDGNFQFQPYSLYLYNGYKVLVTGLTGSNSLTDAMGEDLTNPEIAKNAQIYINEAKKFADYIIVVSNVHSKQFNGVDICKNLTGIDLFIDGGMDTARTDTIGSTSYLATGSQLQSIGLIDIAIVDGKLKATYPMLISKDDINDASESDIAKKYGITNVDGSSKIETYLSSIPYPQTLKTVPSANTTLQFVSESIIETPSKQPSKPTLTSVTTKPRAQAPTQLSHVITPRKTSSPTMLPPVVTPTKLARPTLLKPVVAPITIAKPTMAKPIVTAEKQSGPTMMKAVVTPTQSTIKAPTLTAPRVSSTETEEQTPFKETEGKLVSTPSLLLQGSSVEDKVHAGVVAKLKATSNFKSLSMDDAEIPVQLTIVPYVHYKGFSLGFQNSMKIEDVLTSIDSSDIDYSFDMTDLDGKADYLQYATDYIDHLTYKSKADIIDINISRGIYDTPITSSLFYPTQGDDREEALHASMKYSWSNESLTGFIDDLSLSNYTDDDDYSYQIAGLYGSLKYSGLDFFKLTLGTTARITDTVSDDMTLDLYPMLSTDFTFVNMRKIKAYLTIDATGYLPMLPTYDSTRFFDSSKSNPFANFVTGANLNLTFYEKTTVAVGASYDIYDDDADPKIYTNMFHEDTDNDIFDNIPSSGSIIAHVQLNSVFDFVTLDTSYFMPMDPDDSYSISNDLLSIKMGFTYQGYHIGGYFLQNDLLDHISDVDVADMDSLKSFLKNSETLSGAYVQGNLTDNLELIGKVKIPNDSTDTAIALSIQGNLTFDHQF